MAKGTKLATAYIEITPETKDLGKQVKKALEGTAKHGTDAGSRMGSAMADSMNKSFGQHTRGRNALDRFVRDADASRAGKWMGSAMSSSFTSAMGQGLAKAQVTGFLTKFKNDATKSGNAAGFIAGRAMGAGITAGLTVGTAGLAAVIGGLGTTLFKGFERYKSLDKTAKRLGALGKNADQVKSIVADINSVVEGTPIALDEAASAATQFLQGGVKEGKELKEALTAIADAAGSSGTSFQDLAIIFGQVMNKGKLQAEEMLQLNERGIGIQAALRKEFGWTGDQLEQLSKDGAISFQQLIQAIEGSFGGMAKRAGDTIDGAISNMQTAVARVGADFFSALFGDPLSTTEGPGAMVEALNNITAKINNLDGWVKSHQGEIKQFFTDAADTAKTLGKAVSNVGGFLKEHPDLIKGVVIAFGAWKAIEGVAALKNSLKAISTLLSVTIPASAATGAAATSASLAGITGPAWLLALLGVGAVAAVGTGVSQAHEQGLSPEVTTRFPHLGNPREGSGGQNIPGGGTPGERQRQRRGEPGFFGTAAEQPTGTGVERWRGTFSNVLDRLGLPQEPWLSRGLMQMQTESGGDPNIVNKWDSNAAKGTPSIGLMQVIQPTFDSYLPPGFVPDIRNPESNIAAAIMYTLARYGGPQGWQGHGYGSGGMARGPGGIDNVPAWLTDGEFVVNKAATQRFLPYLQAINGYDSGGEVTWPLPGERRKPPFLPRGNFNPAVKLDTSHLKWLGEPGTYGAIKRILPGNVPGLEMSNLDYLAGFGPGDVRSAQWLSMITGQQRGWLSHLNVKPKGPVVWPPRFAEGGEVTIEELLAQIVGGTQHGLAGGAPIGPGSAEAEQLLRTEGYIPAAAGSTGVAGTSFAASIWNLGSEAAQGAIQIAADLGKMAASAAASAGTFGAGAAAGPAAGAGIQIGADIAKRGVAYGFQMGAIGTDALIEQAFPFGAPRWLGYDYTGFMPQLGIQGALTTTLEKAMAAQMQQGQGQGMAPPMPPGAEHLPPGAQPGVPIPPGPSSLPQPGGLPGQGAPPGPGTPQFGQPPAATGAPQMGPQPGVGQATEWWKGLFGFDSGGWMQPGTGGFNFTNRPEPVFTNAQWSAIQKTATLPPGERGGSVYNIYPRDVDEAVRELRRKERLSMMQHSGRP